MIYSKEVEEMCPVAQGVNHGCAPIPEEARWVKAKEVKDISGFTHGVGWCAPQHSPLVRVHQHRYERAVPPDRIRTFTVCIL